MKEHEYNPEKTLMVIEIMAYSVKDDDSLPNTFSFKYVS